jgi:hypothetical protein
MGVFPLADTLSFSFNPPWSHGVDWHAPPRRNAAAVNAPIHYIANPLVLTRGPAPDPTAQIHSAGSVHPAGPGGSYIRSDRRISRQARATVRHLPHVDHSIGMHAALEPSCRSAVHVFAAGGSRLQ